MPRKKKTDIEVVQENKPMSVEDVDYVMQFARSTIAGMYGLPNVFNPLGVNQRLQDVSLNPAIADADKIEAALNNPKANEKELSGYSEDLYLKNMLMKRMVLYLSNSLSWNLDWVCTTPEAKYASDEYKKDKARMISFFDRFNIKEQFTNILQSMVLNETWFGQLRDDYEKIAFQQLPQQYCTITARNPYGFNFDFNFQWFFQANTSIEMYHPVFKKMYNEVFDKDGNGYEPYNPASSFLARDGSWSMWVQTNLEDGFWAFKLQSFLSSRIPFLAPLFIDASLQPLYRKLAQSSAIQSAQKLLLGQVGLNKDSKGGSLANNFNISADQLGKFLQLVRSGISESIGVTAAPLENMETHSFDLPARNVQSESNMILASQSGISSRLLYTLDKSNLEETRNSISVDEMMLKPVYYGFENFLNFRVNKETKKHKFKFMLNGFEFDSSKRKARDDFFQYANLGVFLPGKLGESLGVQRYDVERMLEESKAEKWEDKVTFITPLFQQSKEQQAANGGGKGRPQKKDEELSESGGETREDGGNLDKGGKI
jgi:hypothetical protein